MLFIIGGKSNNTDIHETLRAHGRCAARALLDRMARRRSTSWSAAAVRTWCAAFGALAETCDALGLPYRFFGFDSAISEVVNYAKQVDEWMKAGGRELDRRHLGIAPKP